MKTKFARFLDSLFLAAVIWLFSAVVALYFIEKLVFVAATATVVTVGIGLLLRLKNSSEKNIKIDKYKVDSLEQHFLFSDSQYAIDYFYKALQKRYKVKRYKFYLMINQTMVVPYLAQPLPLRKAVELYSFARKKQAKCLVVLTFKTEKLPLNLYKKFTDIRFEIFDANKTYLLLKSLDSLPKEEKIPRLDKIKHFLSQAIMPERAKSYLFSAFVLLFGAYFSVFSIYFIVMCAVCITLALLCKLNIMQKFKSKSITKN